VTPTPNFRVLDAAVEADRAVWIALWERWPSREVFAHPAYVDLFATEGSARCAVFEHGDATVLYPFVLRDVPGADDAAPARDTTTPYGYGGAVVFGRVDSGGAADFWEHYDAWAHENSVVSEFVRFSLNAQALLPYPGDVVYKQDNVVRDLTCSAEELWMDFDHKVRKNVKKAVRSGVEVVVDLDGSRFEDFYRIYQSTMDRRDADSGYYFPIEFFEAIHEGLHGQFAYFHAIVDDRVVSTELVLVSATTLYSFLGGTLSDSFDLRPNDMLKHEVMLWGMKTGKSDFVLGGGFEPGDGIYRYKKAFAPGGARPFSVGTRVIDSRRYAELSDASPAKATDDAYFPAYRG
jgi:hypothetical protein